MNAKAVKPSSSYELALPESVCEQSDGSVSSFWFDGQPLLLQLSSYIRETGVANGRERSLEGSYGQARRVLAGLGVKNLSGPTVDQATAEFTDAKGVLWVHTYLVWPHLTIYVIISGPKAQVTDQNNWAIRGLKSVRLVAH